MIHQSKSYLKFLRTSRNQHGVHSPFVYQLVTQCFYKRQQHTAYEIIKSYKYIIDKKHIILAQEMIDTLLDETMEEMNI